MWKKCRKQIVHQVQLGAGVEHIYQYSQATGACRGHVWLWLAQNSPDYYADPGENVVNDYMQDRETVNNSKRQAIGILTGELSPWLEKTEDEVRKNSEEIIPIQKAIERGSKEFEDLIACKGLGSKVLATGEVPKFELLQEKLKALMTTKDKYIINLRKNDDSGVGHVIGLRVMDDGLWRMFDPNLGVFRGAPTERIVSAINNLAITKYPTYKIYVLIAPFY